MALPHSSSLRLGRRSCAGRTYLITFTTFHRRRYFLDWENAWSVARTIASPEAWADSRLLCWVLMPDHWHGVLELGAIDSLSRNVGRAKALAAREWNGKGRLWARAFHDRALPDRRSLMAASRYVIANPVQAGLVPDVGDYPFWDVQVPIPD